MLEMLKKVILIIKLNCNGEFFVFGLIFNYLMIFFVYLLDYNRVFVKWYYNKYIEWYFIYLYIYVYLLWWCFFNYYFNNKVIILYVYVYIYIDFFDVLDWLFKKFVYLVLYLV